MVPGGLVCKALSLCSSAVFSNSGSKVIQKQLTGHQYSQDGSSLGADKITTSFVLQEYGRPELSLCEAQQDLIWPEGHAPWPF